METLQHIPLGVIVLFFALVALGLLQARDRTVSPIRAMILPLAMILFSLYGVYSAFGFSMTTVSFWLLGVLIAGGLSYFYPHPRDAVYNVSTEKFLLRGSYMPLMLIMAIYFTKFFVGYAKARTLPIIEEPMTISIVCILLGFLSGLFLASGYVLYRLKSGISS